jgi:hypothetical protein
MPITDFPGPGDDKSVSLDNSQWPVFPVDEAIRLRDDYPAIWDEGGNIRGNEQFALLAPMAEAKRNPESNEEEQAIRLREAWIARHLDDFQLPGVVAQIKWLAIGSRGIDHMRETIQKAIESQESKGFVDCAIKGPEFLISTDAIDRQGEIVDQDGWDFSNWMKNPVILDSHKYNSIDDVIGRGIGAPKRVGNGWAIEIEFAKTAKGQLAKQLVEDGMIRTVSVGFRSLKRKPNNGVMRHLQQELLEVSLVAIPANPEAIRIKGEHMTQDEMEKPVKKDLELIRGLRDMLVEAVAQAEAIIAYYDEAEPEAEEPEAEMPMEEEAEDSAKRLSDSLKQLLASFNF